MMDMINMTKTQEFDVMSIAGYRTIQNAALAGFTAIGAYRLKKVTIKEIASFFNYSKPGKIKVTFKNGKVIVAKSYSDLIKLKDLYD
jgi:hypothetical protein